MVCISDIVMSDRSACFDYISSLSECGAGMLDIGKTIIRDIFEMHCPSDGLVICPQVRDMYVEDVGGSCALSRSD